MAGWVHRRRDHGGVIFIDLRDREGLPAGRLRSRPCRDVRRSRAPASRVRARGRGARARAAEGTVNPNLATGEIEVLATKLAMLNSRRRRRSITTSRERRDPAALPLSRPAPRADDAESADAPLGHACAAQFMDEHGFIEVETPILSKRRPKARATTSCRAARSRVNSSRCRSRRSYEAAADDVRDRPLLSDRASVSATKTCARTASPNSRRSTSKRSS